MIGFNLSNELKIGKIINGIKIYTDTNTKLKSVNKNLLWNQSQSFQGIDLPTHTHQKCLKMRKLSKGN